MRGERVVVGFHRGEFVFDFEDRLSRLLQSVLKPIGLQVFS